MCYLCLRLMFWKVILMFHSIWWLLPQFEFWNVSWHSSLKRDAKLWHTKVIVSDPERSSSNKPVGGADNKQTDVVRNKPEKTAYISRRHHWFHQEITWRTLKRSNSIHTDDAQLTTQIWIVLLIGWSKCLTNQKHYLCLGSDTSSAWNFYLRSSQTSFRRKISGGIAKCRLFPNATETYNRK